MKDSMRAKLLVAGAAVGIVVATAMSLPKAPVNPVNPANPVNPTVIVAPRAAYLPDPVLTPGAVNAALTKDVICGKGWSTKSVRNVPESEKDAVYTEYHMDRKTAPCPCEVDHLISLELGGSNDIKNLWPESYEGAMNAHEKDKLENRLHEEVCLGKTSLADAQKMISMDWVSAYKARFTAP